MGTEPSAHRLNRRTPEPRHLGTAGTPPPTYLYDAASPRLLTTPRHYAYVKVGRGLRLHVRVLHHPDAARQVSQPRRRLDRRRGRALAAGGVKELLLISQDTTFFGVDRGERGRARATAAPAQRRRRPCAGSGSLSLSDDDHRRRARRDGGVREGLQVHRPAAAARVGGRVAADAAARQPRRPTTSCSRESDRSVPGVTLRTTFIVGFPGETEQDFEELLRVRPRHRLRSRRRLHLLARGRHARLRAGRRRAGRRESVAPRPR